MNEVRTLIVWILICYPVTSFSENNRAELSVKVIGAMPYTGQLMLSLFSSSENFLKKPIRTLSQKVDSSGGGVFLIGDLEHGRYAISIVYDEDDNGELNTGFLGIPIELVGFSNNAKGIVGPPSFKKASFDVPASAGIEIRLGKAKE